MNAFSTYLIAENCGEILRSEGDTISFVNGSFNSAACTSCYYVLEFRSGYLDDFTENIERYLMKDLETIYLFQGRVFTLYLYGWIFVSMLTHLIMDKT